MTDDRGVQPDTGPDPYDEPIDPDIALISDWLARDLSEEAGAAVAKRLREDAAFFEKVWPIVRIWRMRRSYRQLAAEHAATKAPAPESFEYPWVDAPARKPSEAPPARTPRISEVPPDPTPWDRERSRDRAGWEPASGVGAIARELRGIWAYLPTSRSLQATAAGMATVILFIMGYTTFRVGEIRGQRSTFTPYAERRADMEARVAKMDPLAVPVIVRAGESTYALGRTGSKLVRAVSLDSGLVTAVLEGEAYFEVNKEYKKVEVNVGSVIIYLTPGRYAIRCETGSTEVLVTVGEGSATIRQIFPKTVLTLQAGEYGRVFEGKAPERTRGGEGYPALEPPSAIQPLPATKKP